jgi:tetratricopeptide (TPR) repeat protein
MLGLQSAVAQAIAAQIEVKLAPGEHRRLSSPGPVDPEAHDAFLRGRYLWNRRSREALLKSLECFEEALQQHPSYAAAYAGLADSYLTLQDSGYMPTPEAIAKARAAAQQALAIEEGMAAAHNSLAHADFHDFQWSAAEREFKRAIELNPSYAMARFYYANYLAAVGRIDEGIVEARYAQVLDPVSLPVQSNMAEILYYAHQYERAAAQSLSVLEKDPGYFRSYDDLGRAYERQGKYKLAVAAFRKAVTLSRRSLNNLASLAFACALAGRRKEALKLLQELKRQRQRRYVSAYAVALVYIGLGNREEAFSWLERAYRERSSALPFIATNPRLAEIRGDKRFQKLMNRLNLGSQDNSPS